MKTRLALKSDFLCVLSQYEVLHGRSRTSVKEWYPVRPADEAEVKTLLDRPVTEIDPDKGTYVDEEGNVYELATKGATKPIDVERSSDGNKEAGNGQDELLRGNNGGPETVLNSTAGDVAENHRVKGKEAGRKAKLKVRPLRRRSPETAGAQTGASAQPERADLAPGTITFAPLNLRQKLAVVRRRIAYVQKRGHNERHHYSYVTAADIAGAVGDLLAELGVVVVPRLESISHEPTRSPGRAEAEHVARVVMSYSFVDVDTAEEITVKTAGEGLDSGDKAPYKAMTGALKYALLQSFLLATGDDPEDERSCPTSNSSPSTRESRSARLITAGEVCEMRQLIEETGTELDRVLDYYKLGALEEMTEDVYRRAIELLNRKRASQNRRETSHAQS